MLMFVAEMLSDQEKVELVQIINQFLIGKQEQPSAQPTIQDKLGQTQKSKIGRLAKNYYASDLDNKSRVTDDDRVMGRRAYLAMKNKIGK